MKKTLWLMLLSSVLLSGCGYNITEADISNYLQHHVDYKKTYRLGSLLEVDTDLSQLKVKIDPNNQQRVQLNGLLQLHISSFIKNFDFTSHGTFKAKPVYNKEEGAIYLEDMSIQLSDVKPDKYSSIASKFLPKLEQSMRVYLQSHPVYQLDTNKSKQKMIKYFADRIEVQPGYLHLVYKL
ncbi:DUF1439 domain-containing protein [Celerinatantimonas yamalensis]|uniref:DUF1439 domain-containing protein n=1 Tax=Celerinatantimonas yamalensis TaxID=559956 RepID=A0ABW9G9Y2_9GAMM